MNISKLVLIASMVLMWLAMSHLSFGAERPKKLTWKVFVKQVRVEALAQGIRPEVFDEAFRNIHAPNRRVLHFDRTKPEQRLTYLGFLGK